MTGKKLSSIKVAKWTSYIYQFVRSLGGEGVKGVDEGIVILASYMFHFIRVHDNLVKGPSNNKSIVLDNCPGFQSSENHFSY